MINKKYGKNTSSNLPMDMIGVSLTGFLLYYGKWVLPILRDLVFESDFFIESRPLKEIIEDHQDQEMKIFSEDDFTECPAISTSNQLYYFDKDGRCVFEQDPPKLFCSTLGVSQNDLLNIFTHELNHLLKSRIKSHGRIGTNGYWLRNGLHYFTSYLQDRFIYESQQAEMLDEVINVFQTSDIMKEIKQLDSYRFSYPLQSYLRTLDFESLDEPFGYTLTATMLEQFWRNTNFKEQIKRPLILGNLSIIEEDFNRMVEDDLFSSFADSFDELENPQARKKVLRMLSCLFEILQKFTNYMKVFL